MAKTVSVKQAALAKARERRLELHAERQERDRRIEQAAAEVLVLLQQRAEAEQAVAAANTSLGKGLRRVLDEGVGVDDAAQLVELSRAEVRRLTRAEVKAGPGVAAELEAPAGS